MSGVSARRRWRAEACRTTPPRLTVPRPDPDVTVLSDTELVAAMRREDPAAIAELFRRFAPLLRRRAASWLGEGGERDAMVDDVIADVALALLRPTASVPRSLAAYLLTALNHRVAGAKQAECKRFDEECDAAGDVYAAAGPVEGHAARAVAEPALAVVRASVSEHALRSAAGTAAEQGSAPLHPVLARLSTELDAGLSDPDRLLLAWLAEHVPMRTVAAWLGIGYDAALKRSSRLRARLRVAALEHAALLPPAERRVMDAFLGRALGGNDRASSPSNDRSEAGS